MDRARPSILSAIIWAYWDLFHVVRTTWRSALSAFAMLSIGAVAALILPVFLTSHPVGQVIARLVLLIGLSFALTPFLLTVHRNVLLGEIGTASEIEWSSERFQLYFSWVSLIVLVLTIPSFLGAITTPRGLIYYIGSQAPYLGDSLFVAAIRLVALTVVFHLLVLLPAVAIDAPEATWQNAIRDTRRSIWFSLGVTILPLIPIGLLGFAVLPLLGQLPGTQVRMIASAIWLGATLFAGITLIAVCATRLYQVVGHSPKAV